MQEFFISIKNPNQAMDYGETLQLYALSKRVLEGMVHCVRWGVLGYGYSMYKVYIVQHTKNWLRKHWISTSHILSRYTYLRCNITFLSRIHLCALSFNISLIPLWKKGIIFSFFIFVKYLLLTLYALVNIYYTCIA